MPGAYLYIKNIYDKHNIIINININYGCLKIIYEQRIKKQL